MTLLTRWISGLLPPLVHPLHLLPLHLRALLHLRVLLHPRALQFPPVLVLLQVLTLIPALLSFPALQLLPALTSLPALPTPFFLVRYLLARAPSPAQSL